MTGLPGGRGEDDGWAPPGIDVTRPHPARMYDYYLDGKNNFGADREAAEEVIAPKTAKAPGSSRRRNDGLSFVLLPGAAWPPRL